MAESVYKRCKCRDPKTGKDLGASCPKLRRADGSWSPRHGTWYYALELPRGPGGKRRPRMRRGGFATRGEAEGAREQAQTALRRGADPSVRLTTGEYLTDWLAGRVDLKRTTRRNHTITINTYLVPLLGHLSLAELSTSDVAAAFATIREWNDSLAAGEPVRPFQRHVGPAAMQRIRGVLRVALNDAIRDGKIEYNPAARVRMEPEGSRKPIEWTPERTAQFWTDYEAAIAAEPGGGDAPFLVWRRKALRPGKVMVWSPGQAGRFFDAAAGDRLCPVYELIAATALRRGEACGLHWPELELAALRVHVIRERIQVGWEVIEDTPKSDAGDRWVSFDARTGVILQAWQMQQGQERDRWGSDWAGDDHVFTLEDGTPWHPDTVTDRFERIAFAAGLPPVNLHGLRHGSASYALLAGVDVKIVQARLGHSSSTLTRDTYTTVLQEADREAADRIAQMIPRTPRP